MNCSKSSMMLGFSSVNDQCHRRTDSLMMMTMVIKFEPGRGAVGTVRRAPVEDAAPEVDKLRGKIAMIKPKKRVPKAPKGKKK